MRSLQTSIKRWTANAAHPPGDSELLRASDISCSYGGVQAVRGVSLSIPRGGFYGIIGPNGAGKSTLIDCLSGFNRTYHGSVSLAGRDISRWPSYRVAQAGLVRTFQVPRVLPHLTVLSNLMCAPPHQTGEHFLNALAGSWRSQEVANLAHAWDLLQEFELDAVANNYASDVSGGQQRLVELTRALMAEPSTLLLDEPFAGVSPRNRARLAAQLRDLRSNRGVTVVMVEHRLEWVEHLCDSVIVMAQGEVIAQGTMAEMRKHHEVVASYLGDTA